MCHCIECVNTNCWKWHWIWNRTGLLRNPARVVKFISICITHITVVQCLNLTVSRKTAVHASLSQTFEVLISYYDECYILPLTCNMENTNESSKQRFVTSPLVQFAVILLLEYLWFDVMYIFICILNIYMYIYQEKIEICSYYIRPFYYLGY